MYRALIDTCVWLDLAQDSRRFPELAAIEEMVRRGALTLIVPQLAIDEFHRRREDIAIANSTALTPHIRHLKAFAARADMHAKKVATLVKLLDELAAHGSLENEVTAQALDRIERMLLAAPRIADTQDVLAAATKRGLDKRAPFLDSNGMADAILVETYAACVRTSSKGEQFAFITHNKQDFSNMHGNHNLPHPHLEEAFRPGKSYYFIDLALALRQIEPAVFSEVLARTQPTVRDVVERYLEANQELGESQRFGLQRITSMAIAKRQVAKLRPSDYLEHVKTRRKTVAASTAMHEFICLKGAFTWAHRHLGTDVSVEILERARKAALAQGHLTKYKEAPVRRLSLEDERRLISAFKKRQMSKSNQIDMVDVVIFAVWSARRRDEICRLRWEDFHRESRTCAVRDVWRKGSKITFPLIGPALDIVVRRQKDPGDSKLIFPYNSKSVGAAFTLVKNELGLDFTFGELREEGLRRLIEAQQYPIALVQRLDPKKVFEIQEQMKAGEP